MTKKRVITGDKLTDFKKETGDKLTVQVKQPEIIKSCLNCKFSRDWCCEKKRRKQYITCVADLTVAPLELHHNSNCHRWIYATGK